MSRRPADGTIRYIIKSHEEDLGTIVIASLYYGGRAVWREAVFSAEPRREVFEAFRLALKEVSPEIEPPEAPKDWRLRRS